MPRVEIYDQQTKEKRGGVRIIGRGPINYGPNCPAGEAKDKAEEFIALPTTNLVGQSQSGPALLTNQQLAPPAVLLPITDSVAPEKKN